MFYLKLFYKTKDRKMRKKTFKLVSSDQERFIWLEGVINRQTAGEFIKQLTKLNNDGSDPIFLYVSGPGGLLDSCLDMIIAINNSKSKVLCVAHGEVASSSFVLTQAATIGFRLAIAGTKFKFHRALYKYKLAVSIKAGTSISQEDYLARLKILTKFDGVILAMFFLKCKPNRRMEIIELQQAEEILSVKRAISLGIMDNYFDKKDFSKDRKIAKALIKQRKSS